MAATSVMLPRLVSLLCLDPSHSPLHEVTGRGSLLEVGAVGRAVRTVSR